MALELCEENADILNSVTVMYLLYDKEQNKDSELINLLSHYIRNLIVASTIKEAKEKAAGRDIDILITDFNLADSESLEFPVYIRRMNPSCSIIVYTAKNDPDHFMEAIDLKVDKYLIKPCSIKEITKVIVNCAENAFTLKSLYSYRKHNFTHLDTEAYDTISQSIDELRIVITKMANQHCMEAMPVIHSIKGVIANMKTLLRNSY